jgi:hypothetical protein
MLKKFAAILFLSIYLISTTELHQLAKLPLLLEHFGEHKEQNNQLTFLEFLTIHYSGETNKDADYEKDMQLPFKSHDGCVTTFIAAYIAPSLSSFVLKEFSEKITSFPSFEDCFLSSNYLSNIWQPPKNY